MKQCSALIGIALLLAVMAAVAGCQQPGSSIPPPAFFSCPPGSRLVHDATGESYCAFGSAPPADPPPPPSPASTPTAVLAARMGPR